MRELNNGFVEGYDKDLTAPAMEDSSPRNSRIYSTDLLDWLSSFSFGAPKADEDVLTSLTYPSTREPLGQMSRKSRSTPEAPNTVPSMESRYHYSLRLQSPASLDPSAPSRTTIPRTTEHLSLDYSFVHDKTQTSPHPSLHDIDARIAKHVRYLVSLSTHHHSFHTFKLIIITANCCKECSEASVTATFGYVPLPHTPNIKLSLTQQAFLKLRPKLRDNFSVVAFLDPVNYHHPRGYIANKLIRMLPGQKVAEIGEAQSELGVKIDGVQRRAQVDLEVVKDWPVVFSWFCWTR